MAQTPMFRVNQISKDLGIKTKEMQTALAESGVGEKNTAATLEADDFNLLVSYLTEKNQIKGLDDYLSGKTFVPSPERDELIAKREAKAKADMEKKAAAEAEAKAKAEAEAKAKAQAEAKAKAEAEAAAKAAAEAKAKADAEAKAAAEAEEKRRAEELHDAALRKAAAKAKADAEARRAAAAAKAEGKTDARDKRSQQGQQGANGRDAAKNDRFDRNARRAPQQPQRPAAQGQTRADAEKARVEAHNRITDARQKANGTVESEAQRIQNQSVSTPRTVAMNIQNQGMAGARKKKQQPTVETKRTGSVRIVDTRGGGDIDLSKYDEKLDSFNSGVSDSETSKQKLKKQNTRDMRSAKTRDKERLAMEKLKKANLEKAKKAPLKVTIPDTITVSELASRLKATAASVVKRLMMMGMMVSANQEIDFDTAYLVADEMGAEVTREVVVTIEEKLFEAEQEDDEGMVTRDPVVCVMGHVDHGKTSLLDRIRNTNVTSGEAGGITQAIGAYRVNLNGRDITFLDTPGHEAFTAMRARGAQATDVAILVVAADDGIMPQTVEAINHAKAAGIDIVVAINKMDKPGANPDAIKSDLTKYDLVPEDWGGDVICVPVSALTGMGIEDLLESVLLVADVKDMKANPNRRAKGIVIESRLDKGRGPVATVLVQNGTLHAGDTIIAGTAVGRVRAMMNDRGQALKEAGPSVPVEITGLAEVPQAGDEFNAVEDERMARTLAEQRRQAAKEEVFSANAKVSLDDLFAQIAEGVKELNIIVKADVNGSAEAVKQSLEKLSNDEVRVRVIHSAVGGITEGDVTFAAASNAIIVGFSVRPDKAALDLAERQGVDIRTYRIIYECIEEIEAALKGMLAPTYKEVLLGHAEVRQTIHVPNVGTIAGSYVQDGKIARNAMIRIVRDGIVIAEDKISSLKRFKDDAKEVAAGYECGVGLEKFNDIHEGDVMEAFIMEEVER